MTIAVSVKGKVVNESRWRHEMGDGVESGAMHAAGRTASSCMPSMMMPREGLVTGEDPDAVHSRDHPKPS